jgi:hypothetical protein
MLIAQPISEVSLSENLLILTADKRDFKERLEILNIFKKNECNIAEWVPLSA